MNLGEGSTNIWTTALLLLLMMVVVVVCVYMCVHVFDF